LFDEFESKERILMNFDTQIAAIVAGVVILGLVAAFAWLIYRNNQSERLKQRFGAEYNQAVTEHGGQAKAESELKAREARVDRLTILPLAAPEAARFSKAWQALQGRFVDNPTGVLIEADQLVRDLMVKLGYPMADFAHRAADISVDYPVVVENYRAAQATALREQRGEADTEELRKGVVHYRALLEELLGVHEPTIASAAPAKALA
jgi:hypothetical protein